jgi:hypothetical protein
MEILSLVDHINLATDEDFELMTVLKFCNDAIAKINVEAKAQFPFIDLSLKEKLYKTEEYVAIPETWIRMLIVPFAAGRIKENDSSQFEYQDWYAQFDLNLRRFTDDFDIPEEYQIPDTKVKFYEGDLTGHIYSPLRGW